MSIQLAPPVEIICLCEGEWRLSDARIAAQDSRRLISYVTYVGGAVEVLWLPTLCVQHMPSLQDAVDAALVYCDLHEHCR